MGLCMHAWPSARASRFTLLILAQSTCKLPSVTARTLTLYMRLAVVFLETGTVNCFQPPHTRSRCTLGLSAVSTHTHTRSTVELLSVTTCTLTLHIGTAFSHHTHTHAAHWNCIQSPHTHSRCTLELHSVTTHTLTLHFFCSFAFRFQVGNRHTRELPRRRRISIQRRPQLPVPRWCAWRACSRRRERRVRNADCGV